MYLITKETDPIRWLHEMADSSSLGSLPCEAHMMVYKAVCALGDRWPVPLERLQVLASHIHIVQTNGDEMRDGILEDLLEMYQFVVQAIHDWDREHTDDPVVVRTTAQLAQDIVEGSQHRVILSLEEVQDVLDRNRDRPSHERIVAAIESLEGDGLGRGLYDREGTLHAYRVNHGPDDHDDCPF